jgi:hypothetical protein
MREGSEEHEKEPRRGARKFDDSDLGGVLRTGEEACLTCQKGRKRPWNCWVDVGFVLGQDKKKKDICRTCSRRSVRCVWLKQMNSGEDKKDEVVDKGEGSSKKRKVEVPEVVIPRKKARTVEPPSDPIGRAAWHLNNPGGRAELENRELILDLHRFFTQDLIMRKNELEYRRIMAEEVGKLRSTMEAIFNFKVLRDQGLYYPVERSEDSSSDETDPGIPEELHDRESDEAPEVIEVADEPEEGEKGEVEKTLEEKEKEDGSEESSEESSEDESEGENKEKEAETEDKEKGTEE